MPFMNPCSTLGDSEKCHLKILEHFFSVHKDFLIAHDLATLCRRLLIHTSHMRIKARKEGTRWYKKIRLSRSLVVKLAIWLPAGKGIFL